MSTSTPTLITTLLAETEYEQFEYPRITYEEFGLKYLHSNVFTMLVDAHQYGGVAYGGYVRDIITKVTTNDFSAVSTKDVDIWFKDKEKRNNFVDRALSTGRARMVTNRDRASLGTNSVVLGLFDIWDSFLIYVDCVFSTIFPVYDLDVNHLTFNTSTGKISAMGMYSLPNLLKNISNKVCVPTRTCYSMLTNDCSDFDIECYQMLATKIRRRVMKRFVAEGWTIKDNRGAVLELKCSKGEDYMRPLVVGAGLTCEEKAKKAEMEQAPQAALQPSLNPSAYYPSPQALPQPSSYASAHCQAAEVYASAYFPSPSSFSQQPSFSYVNK